MTITTHQFSRPAFIVDHQSVDRDNGHQIDWANVPEDYRETKGGTVTLAANAAIDAVALVTDPLTFAIPAGTLLQFGLDEYATVTVAAAVGAEALTVEPLVTAVEIGDIALVTGSGLKTIPAGTVMGIVTAGSPAVSKMYPRVATSNPADGLLATTAVEGDKVAALSGHGLIIGGVVYENLLPDSVAGALPAAMKSELATNSKGFVYRPYADDRAS